MAKERWRKASMKINTAATFRKMARPRRRNVMDEGTDAFEGQDVHITKVEKPEETKAMIQAAMDGNFVFQMLPKRTVRLMVDCMQAAQIEHGTEIIRQGDNGDFFYVTVIHGSA